MTISASAISVGKSACENTGCIFPNDLIAKHKSKVGYTVCFLKTRLGVCFCVIGLLDCSKKMRVPPDSHFLLR